MHKGSNHFEKQMVMGNLYQHVETLSVKIGDRHLWKDDSLNQAADYIESGFTSYGYAVERQTYVCYGKTVFNLIAQKTGKSKEVVVIGAHYDTVPGTPGADDNASAVAGLMELGRLLKESSSRKTLVFVAFVNEEPPCFGSTNMGSMVYAKHLKDQKISIEVMVSLEMIGFFSDRPGSQHYPIPFMNLKFPKTGNFIAMVGNRRSRQFTQQMAAGFKMGTGLPLVTLNAPAIVVGIDFSDHWSFGKFGYPALMVTDTAFYRNANYHAPSDLPDTLDYTRMAQVVDGLKAAIEEWGKD
jgi:Zn-dependent M28 family amino/carboxypeptidase